MGENAKATVQGQGNHFESTIDGVDVYRSCVPDERYYLFPVGREALTLKPSVFVGPGVDPLPAIEQCLTRFNCELERVTA